MRFSRPPRMTRPELAADVRVNVPGCWLGQSDSIGVFRTLKSASKISIPGLAEGVYYAEVLVEKCRTAQTRWQSFANALLNQSTGSCLQLHYPYCLVGRKGGIIWEILTQIRSTYKRVAEELRIPNF